MQLEKSTRHMHRLTVTGLFIISWHCVWDNGICHSLKGHGCGNATCFVAEWLKWQRTLFLHFYKALHQLCQLGKENQRGLSNDKRCDPFNFSAKTFIHNILHCSEVLIKRFREIALKERERQEVKYGPFKLCLQCFFLFPCCMIDKLKKDKRLLNKWRVSWK